ncbi:MAG: hypothetical protein U0939_14315 [Pirellulales bacterium]
MLQDGLFDFNELFAVVPVLVGPLQMLATLAPALAVALGAALWAWLSPSGLRAVGRFVRFQKLFTAGVVALVAAAAFSYWNPWRTTCSSAFHQPLAETLARLPPVAPPFRLEGSRIIWRAPLAQPPTSLELLDDLLIVRSDDRGWQILDAPTGRLLAASPAPFPLAAPSPKQSQVWTGPLPDDAAARVAAVSHGGRLFYASQEGELVCRAGSGGT